MKEIWYKVPEYPNYEVNNMGIARHINGKLLKMCPNRGYSLERDGEQRYIRPPRLLYAALHGVSPVGIRNLVVLEVNGVLTPMTRTEYAQFVNSRRKYSTLTPDEAIGYYKEAIRFAQMVLDYYETGDMSSVVKELSKYEGFAKNYIRKRLLSNNDDTINESWDCIFYEIISKMHDGCISIIEPRSYILKSVRIHFNNFRKMKRPTIQLEDYYHKFNVYQ